MAEQAHFAKYKISLKNNNKESQQVNEATGQRGHEGRAIRKFDSSKIRGFKNSWRWIDKKRRRNLKNFSSLQLFNHFFLFSCQFLNTINPKVGLVAFFLIPKCQMALRAIVKAAVGAVVDIHIIFCAKL